MTAGSPGLSSNIDPTPAEVRAEARAIRAAEIAAAKEIRSVTLKTLFAFLFVTLLLTMVSTWRAAATTFVLAIACTTVGFIVGLLFSIPRAVAVGADLIAAAQQRQQEQLGQPGQQTPANSSLGLSRNLLSVNTNLEQVSDWLTKIFVGVGLVEFNNIKSAVIHGANLIGKALRESGTPIDTGTLIGVGIIVVYPGLGFLVGFFSVRLYISRAMWASDAEVARAYDPYNDELRTTMDLTTPRTSTSGPPGETAKPAEAPPEVRREALGVPLSALTKTEDILTRGRAAQQEGLTEDARAAFKRAIAQIGRAHV